MQALVAAELQAIFQAPDRPEAERLLRLAIERYQHSAPKLADWMEHHVPQGLTVMTFEPPYRPKLRTTNHLERIHREIKRRTAVASIFPRPEACLRLVSAILLETDEGWQSSEHVYMHPNHALPQSHETNS